MILLITMSAIALAVLAAYGVKARRFRDYVAESRIERNRLLYHLLESEAQERRSRENLAKLTNDLIKARAELAFWSEGRRQ
jgi:hypothetical protein